MDGLSTRLLKLISPEITKAITLIINQCMYTIVNNYFYKSQFFLHQQYYFRSKFFTELAALHLIDYTKTEMDNGNMPLNIYLDV